MNQFELHKALLAALKTHTGVSGLVGTRIYDVPPTASNPVYPYLTLGETIVTPLDNKDAPGENHLVVVNTWTSSASAGRSQVKQIQDQIHAALHWKTWTFGQAKAFAFVEANRVLSDPDQAGVHRGVTQLRVLIP